jgi:hypothetical protein
MSGDDAGNLRDRTPFTRSGGVVATQGLVA